jgi:hypothetical protein
MFWFVHLGQISKSYWINKRIIPASSRLESHQEASQALATYHMKASFPEAAAAANEYGLTQQALKVFCICAIMPDQQSCRMHNLTPEGVELVRQSA